MALRSAGCVALANGGVAADAPVATARATVKALGLRVGGGPCNLPEHRDCSMLIEIPRTASNPEIPQITAEEASAAARAVIELFARWELSDSVAREILGSLTPRTYARWKMGNHPRLNRDLSTRLSLLMGIHTSLRNLFGNRQRAYGWVTKPNTAFGGQTPAAVMAEGSIFALGRIRSYLDAERSGW